MIRDGITVLVAAGTRRFSLLSSLKDFVPYDISCKRDHEEMKSKKWSVFVASSHILRISGGLGSFPGPPKSAFSELHQSASLKYLGELPAAGFSDIGRVQGPSALLVAQLLRSDLVELRPSQFSLLLRERAISRSDITNCAVRARRHIEIAIGTARYEPNLF